MYRAASHLPKRSLLAASSLAATTVVLHERKEKPSIYANPTSDILLVAEPSPLEQQIGVARRQIIKTYSDAHTHVQGWVSRWIGVEHAVENRVKSIISPKESLTPGLLYVGIATLSGSIIARNRILATRLLLPPTFLIISANHFLPKTTANLSAYLGSLEETYFPTLAQKHDIANAHSHMAWERIKEATLNGRDQLSRGAVVTVEKIQEVTGLKLRETLGLEAKAIDVVVAAERTVQEAKSAVEKKVENVKVETKEKTEDVKRLV